MVVGTADNHYKDTQIFLFGQQGCKILFEIRGLIIPL